MVGVDGNARADREHREIGVRGMVGIGGRIRALGECSRVGIAGTISARGIATFGGIISIQRVGSGPCVYRSDGKIRIRCVCRFRCDERVWHRARRRPALSRLPPSPLRAT